VSTLAPSDVRHLPLFRALSDAHIGELLRAFTPRAVPAGTVLFREGEVPSTFLLLTKGEVELTESTEPHFTVRPVAPLGELGALTGLPRHTTAKAVGEVEVLEASVDAVHRLFPTAGARATILPAGTGRDVSPANPKSDSARAGPWQRTQYFARIGSPSAACATRASSTSTTIAFTGGLRTRSPRRPA